jgi:hypothetical protein
MSKDAVVIMLEKYKSEAELRAFATAQFKTITELSKKINNLEEENIHLKKLLADSTPILGKESSESPRRGISLVRPSGDVGEFATDDEEQIAVMELRRLRDIAIERSLTLEETKKAEVFFKMMQQIKNQPKTIVVETKKMSTEELLALTFDDNKEEK